MKTICFTLFFILCVFTSPLLGQIRISYPIPSFDVLVVNSAVFQENTPSNTKAKRVIHVRINVAQKTDTSTCIAEVLIYSLDHQSVLGTYNVECGTTLSVEIDDREWGVSVTSKTPVDVSVWIDQGFLNKENNLTFQIKADDFCKPD